VEISSLQPPTGARRARRLRQAFVAALSVVLALAVTYKATAAGEAAAAINNSNPFMWARVYVDPSSDAAKAAASMRTSAPANAALLDKIATRPQADWFGDWLSPTQIQAAVDKKVTAATNAGRLALLVAYDIPERDCGSYSGGGATSAANYRAWIDGFAKGIKGRHAVIILEPDALPQLDCLKAADQTLRLSLIKGAVDRFAAEVNASVYLDAGHGAWKPANVMAQRLTAAGIANARGFAINDAAFDPLPNEITYAKALSALTGGKHAVIDTSRNGKGWANVDQRWCNPPGRALGVGPTTVTADPAVDAYLWLKHPGASDGPCRPGAPIAGTFWVSYALELARNAAY
jgi:endoglucanase